MDEEQHSQSGRMPPPAPPRRPISSSTKLALIIVGVVVGLRALIGGIVFAIAVVDELNSPSATSLLQTDEEEGIRGLSATIFQLGQAGNADAFLALAQGDGHADPQALRSQFQRAFVGTRPVDYTLKEDAVQVLVDTQTTERIVVVRLGLSTEGGNRDSGPLYMIKRDGQWKLTGLSGRQVKEQTE